jgi:hypothetical protein
LHGVAAHAAHNGVQTICMQRCPDGLLTLRSGWRGEHLASPLTPLTTVSKQSVCNGVLMVCSLCAVDGVASIWTLRGG